MGFPSRDATLTAANKLERAKSEAFSVKQGFVDFIRTIGSQNISPTSLVSITGRLVGLKKEAQALLDHEGMDDYTEKELGRPISQDAINIIDKIDAALLALKDAIPSDKDGYLKIATWDNDGTVAWPALTPPQLAEVRAKIQDVMAAIE